MGEPARKLDDPPYEVHKAGTFDELWAEIQLLPEGVTGEIIVPGVLWTKRRPVAKHRRAVGGLMHALSPVDAGIGGTGWWIEREPEVRLGDRLVVPDLVGFRAEKNDETPPECPIITRPDFCCEVLSQSTARQYRAKKLPLYARFGVEWIWLVDPEYSLVEVYESRNGFAAFTAAAEDSEVIRLPPFDVEIDFSRFWVPEARTQSAAEATKTE